ncbi:MAG: hypothetical protein ACLFSB_06660 [Chitinispirillaceae bacterium]
MDRHIIHINIVGFYVAVAQAPNPRLCGYPVAVATAGSSRRIVLDTSLVAREAGVHKGLPVERAMRLCPDLVVLNPIPQAYRRAFHAVVEQGTHISPLVEPAGPGHVFVDVTGTQRLFGRSVDVADRLHKEIKNKLNLPSTVGVGQNKLVSKIATRVIKPMGVCTVFSGCEDEFMAPLPIQLLPGIDHTVIRQLMQFNFSIIRDLHAIDPHRMVKALGTIAFEIAKLSHGVDTAPVRALGSPAPMVHKQVVLKEFSNDEGYILHELRRLVEKGGMELRRQGLAARRIGLTITFTDGSQVRRTMRLAVPLNGNNSIYDRCHALFESACTRRIRLSSIDLYIKDLVYPYGQMDLFYDNQQECRLMNALDSIRLKYGFESIGVKNDKSE